MKNVLILLFLIIKQTISINSKYDQFLNPNSVCPAVYCGEQAEVNGVCLENTRNSINRTELIMRRCPINQYCNYLDIINFTLINPINCSSINLNYFSNLPKGQLVEQDYCRENDDCSSKNCINNICYGLPENSTCKNTTDCNSDTFCNKTTKICTSRRDLNQSCEEDENCSNFAGCFNKTCTTIFSLNSGVKVNSLSDSIFCKSYYVSNDLICEDYINLNPFPYFCKVAIGSEDDPGDCLYQTSISKRNFSKNYCYCDMNGNGFAYCGLGTNTTEWKDYTISVVVSRSNKCHYYNKARCALTPYEDYIKKEMSYAIANQKKRVNLFNCYYPYANISINPGTCNKTDCLDEIKILLNKTNSSKFYQIFSVIVLLLNIII
jgi:hypothetical protein